jgi:LPXTG-motif cell wall-anchored protein
MRTRTRLTVRALAAGVAAAALVAGSAVAANAYPSDDNKPDIPALLTGYYDFWTPESGNALHGTVDDADVLAHNDELTVWINNNATESTRFAALQDSLYGASPDSYDQSITASTAMGSLLGPIYVEGRQSGALPLTSALVSTLNGSSGAYVSTGTAKAAFSYPRPYLPTNVNTDQTGWNAGCLATNGINGSSLAAIRDGQPYAVSTPESSAGNLDIGLLPAVTDDSHEFTVGTPLMNPDYGNQLTDDSGICTGGSFPSGHTTSAYQADLTLAMLLPEIAPELATRASEGGLHRVVLGVHYPLDVIGGRIAGSAGIAARWSDADYRTSVLEPAAQELRGYLESQCGDTIANCYAKGQPYESDPFGGQAMPGGTSQTVTDRQSAVATYTERLTYGFDTSGQTGLAPSVPTGAASLLSTVFPTLTDDQRTSVLAQTEIASGYPLDLTEAGNGSWQRIDLAAAMSATVQKNADGSVTVTSTGGTATVLDAGGTATVTGPKSVGAGESGTFTFSGFRAGETVEVTLQGESASSATLALVHAAVDTKTFRTTASATGQATVTVTLPANARGTYTLSARGLDSGVTGSTTFAVSLPATGLDAGSMTGIWVGGAVLALGGLAAVGFGARRRARSTRA